MLLIFMRKNNEKNVKLFTILLTRFSIDQKNGEIGQSSIIKNLMKIKDDCHPITNVNGKFQDHKGVKLFTLLDLANEYYQIEIELETNAKQHSVCLGTLSVHKNPFLAKKMRLKVSKTYDSNITRFKIC